jgi:thioredoxin reductase (NADPH)
LVKRAKIFLGVIFLGISSIGACFGLKKEGYLGYLSNIWHSHSPVAFSFDMQSLKSLNHIMPLVIIGSGPAALNAATYGARARIDTLVIRGNKPGGALTETSYIENWPGRAKILGTQLMQDLAEQARSFGAIFLNDTVDMVNFSTWPFIIHTQDDKTIHALSVIICTGSTPRTLSIPGEQEYWGKGVTTCAICDAPFHKDHDVVVIGGGDSAAEEAMQLAPYAKNVSILVRKDRMRAAESMQERLREYPNISIIYNVEVQKIIGNSDHVTSIELFDSKMNKTSIKQVEGVFLAIGHDPNTALFKDQLEMNKQGYITMKNRTQQTSVPGVFAAGDVEDNRYRQAGVAAGNGIKAALDAIAFLQEHGFSSKVAQSIKSNLFTTITEQSVKVGLLATQKDFEHAVRSKKGTVVLDFYADYCPSCMRMLPDLELVAYTYADQATFYKVDLDQAKELAETLHVQSIPTLLVYHDGQLVGRYNQAMNKKELSDFVTKFVQA